MIDERSTMQEILDYNERALTALEHEVRGLKDDFRKLHGLTKRMRDLTEKTSRLTETFEQGVKEVLRRLDR